MTDFMPIEETKTLVANGQRFNRKLALPIGQLAGATNQYEAYSTINMNPSSALLSGGAQEYTYTLDRAAVKRINNIFIRVDVRCSNAAVQLVPVTHFFSQIDVRHAAESTNIRTYFPDTLAFSLYTLLDDAKLRSFAKLINIDKRFSSIFGLGPEISAGQTRSFYIPLIGNVFEDLKANWINAGLDLQFRFVPASEGIVAVGSAANISVTGMSLLIDQPANDLLSHLEHDKIESMFYKAVNYLDPVQISTYANTLITTGSTLKLDLSQLNGNVSHLLFMIRDAGASNVGWTKGIYRNLGDEGGALIDIKNQTGDSIIGNGNAIQTKFLRDFIMPSQMGSELPTRDALYMLPFCKNVSKALNGIFTGHYRFESNSKHFLEITPQPGVNEVQTFTCSAAPGDGTYKFYLDGEFSEALAFNANAAAMKAAVEKMTFCKRRGITVTFSGALANNVTVTIVNPGTPGFEQRKLEVIGNNLNDGAGGEVRVDTAITTAGYAGLATGTYDILIYAWYQKRAFWARRVYSELL